MTNERLAILWVRPIRQPLTEVESHRLTEFAKEELGKPLQPNYRFLRLVVPGRPAQPSHDDQREWFCSELVAQGLLDAGVLHTHLTAGSLVPADLFHDRRVDLSERWSKACEWTAEQHLPPRHPLLAPAVAAEPQDEPREPSRALELLAAGNFHGLAAGSHWISVKNVPFQIVDDLFGHIRLHEQLQPDECFAAVNVGDQRVPTLTVTAHGAVAGCAELEEGLQERVFQHIVRDDRDTTNRHECTHGWQFRHGMKIQTARPRRLGSPRRNGRIRAVVRFRTRYIATTRPIIVPKAGPVSVSAPVRRASRGRATAVPLAAKLGRHMPEAGVRPGNCRLPSRLVRRELSGRPVKAAVFGKTPLQIQVLSLDRLEDAGLETG